MAGNPCRARRQFWDDLSHESFAKTTFLFGWCLALIFHRQFCSNIKKFHLGTKGERDINKYSTVD